MDKSLCDDQVFYLRNASYPTGASGKRRRQRVIRRHMQKYELYGRRLRQGSRLVLHTKEAFDVLYSFHLKKGHI